MVTANSMRRIAASVGLVLVAAPLGSRPAGSQRYTGPAVEVPRVVMGASCLPEAREAVDRGAALLFLMASDLAQREYDRAAEVDPDCALAYWGQALVLLPSSGLTPPGQLLDARALDAGREALTRARAVPARSSRERALLDALAIVFGADSSETVPSRLERFAERLETLADASADNVSLTVLAARARLALSTLVGDPASDAAAARLRAVLRRAPDNTVAAVTLLAARDGWPHAPDVRAAADAVLHAPLHLPGPYHLALRTYVRLGDWEQAVRAGQAAIREAGSPVATSLLLGSAADFAPEWMLEAFIQQGRIADARGLLTRVERTLDGSPHELIANAADRMRVRLVFAADDWQVARTLPTGGFGPATRWLARFAQGLASARLAWPGGDRTLLSEARDAVKSIHAAEQASGGTSVPALARVLVEAAMAGSQDEHHQFELLIAHAVALEDRLVTWGRLTLPFVPAEELAAETYLQWYRYPDAQRAASAALERYPGRVRAQRALARALEAGAREE
jgi:tetratricopeptide (TPR) repeat protein